MKANLPYNINEIIVNDIIDQYVEILDEYALTLQIYTAAILGEVQLIQDFINEADKLLDEFS